MNIGDKFEINIFELIVIGMTIICIVGIIYGQK